MVLSNLEDVTGEDNLIELFGLEPTFLTTREDGACAVYYNAEAVQQAAAQALGSYTGTYGIRISFVPTGDSSNEFAITFNSTKA